MSNPRHPNPHRSPVRPHKSSAPPPPPAKLVPQFPPMVRARPIIRIPFKIPGGKANVGIIIENKTYTNYVLSLAIA